jgi:hypothetical protein
VPATSANLLPTESWSSTFKPSCHNVTHKSHRESSGSLVLLDFGLTTENIRKHCCDASRRTGAQLSSWAWRRLGVVGEPDCEVWAGLRYGARRSEEGGGSTAEFLGEGGGAPRRLAREEGRAALLCQDEEGMRWSCRKKGPAHFASCSTGRIDLVRFVLLKKNYLRILFGVRVRQGLAQSQPCSII